MLGVIYKATCSISGKSYIGQTKNFQKRKAEHLRAKDNYAFHLALRKYGPDAFKWTILEECKLSDLDEREIYWISYYDTYNSGYNSTIGGDNAESLENWRLSHPQEARDQALKALEIANQYNKEHREERLSQFASVRQKGIDKTKCKVKCIELDLDFDSLADAERWSISPSNPNGKKASHQHISKVCTGKRKTAGGYSWKYISKGDKNYG